MYIYISIFISLKLLPTFNSNNIKKINIKNLKLSINNF